MVLGPAVQLPLVPVQQDHQVIQLLGAGEGHGLPDLALVALAVAHDEEHPGIAALQLVAQCHAAGQGGSLSQGAGGHVHARGLVPVAVAGQTGAGPVQGLQLLIGDKALHRQRAVHRRTGVALGADQLVALGPLGVVYVDAHLPAVQRRQHVADAQRAAQMAGAQGVDGLQRRHSDF